MLPCTLSFIFYAFFSMDSSSEKFFDLLFFLSLYILFYFVFTSYFVPLLYCTILCSTMTSEGLQITAAIKSAMTSKWMVKYCGPKVVGSARISSKDVISPKKSQSFVHGIVSDQGPGADLTVLKAVVIHSDILLLPYSHEPYCTLRNEILEALDSTSANRFEIWATQCIKSIGRSHRELSLIDILKKTVTKSENTARRAHKLRWSPSSIQRRIQRLLKSVP